MNPVDLHNKLRQGERSMADAWLTHSWPTRHFAEMLGFIEVNIYKALHYFKKGRWSTMNHNTFRRRLAHAFLTLGKEPFPDDVSEINGGGSAASTFRSPSSLLSIDSASGLFSGPGYDHEFVLFNEAVNVREMHRCGYCGNRSAKYCKTCFDLGRGKSGRGCIDDHAAGLKLKHSSHTFQIKRKAQNDVEQPCHVSMSGRTRSKRRIVADDDE